MSASIVYPPALTRPPRVDSLNETAPENSVRSETDVGPAKVRRRFTGDRRVFSIVLDYKRSEVAVFDDFYLTTTKGGSLPFVWKNPRTGSDVDMRFLSTPQYRPRSSRNAGGSDWWTVSFDVETMPGTDSSTSTPPGDVYWPGGGGFGVSSFVGEETEDLGCSSGTGEIVDWFIPFDAVSAPPSFLIDIIAPHYGANGLAEEGAEETPNDSSGYSVLGDSEAGGQVPVTGAIVGGRTSIVPA